MGPRCLRAALLPLLLLLELPGARGDCGPPPRFAFAEPPLPLNDSYPSGTSLRYRCRTGYTVASGKSPYVTCLPNSTWSAESDFCIGKLCSPPDIPNGKFDYVTDLRFGAVINFACNEGYRLIGDSSAECILQGSDVTWSQVPYCEIIPCMPPPGIENGELNAESRDFTFGSTVTYSCHVGFSLIGESSIHCTSDDNLNGKWSGPAPECKVIGCTSPPAIANGEFSAGSRVFTLGSTVTYSCHRGFSLIGESTIHCISDDNLNGKWSGTAPECKGAANKIIAGILPLLLAILAFHF